MAESSSATSVASLLLASAGQDLAACQLLATGANIGDAMVGFHAQQAVEKSLKAALSANRIEFRRTHDLALLLDLLQDNNVPSSPEAEWLGELNPYAVEARYGTIGSEDLDRGRALSAAVQVLAWAELQVSSVDRVQRK